MKRLLKELRRREVFRTAGLYVGICWILIEVASVMLPAFGAPDWLFRGAIVAAVAGFPVMLVLAWFIDVSEAGINFQGDPTDTVVQQLGARKSDFAIIGLLVLALAVSLFLNIKNETPPETERLPISVLVTDFAGSDAEPLFAGVLEQALIVGLEVAPHITAVDRSRALTAARQPTSDDAQLDLDLARRIAQHTGISMLLAGSVQASGDGYRLDLNGIDVADDRAVFTISEQADSQDDVLLAIGKLATEVRKQLGDTTPSAKTSEQPTIFKAASLEAAQAYTAARQLEVAGDLEGAATSYAQAVAADPGLGRAVANLALVESALGRNGDAARHWTTALSLMDALTERERLQTLARYQASVMNDADAAAARYSELVSKFPSDFDARERLAELHFQQLDFAKAMQEIRAVMKLFPAASAYQAKLALYAMYQGDSETARTAAHQVLAADPAYGTAYLPLAIAALGDGNIDAARDAYQRMASASQTGDGASTAQLGLADIDLYLGRFDAAETRLITGIAKDIDDGNPRLATGKSLALAELYVNHGNVPAAVSTIDKALVLRQDTATRVMAALVYFNADKKDSMSTMIDALSVEPDAHSRAYALMLKGLILEAEGGRTEAILAMRQAIAAADLWLIRYQIAQAYLRAGNYTEALGELAALKNRKGEASAVFLDGMPTYRLLSTLPYWNGRVQEALNMSEAARTSYAEFLALRPEGGVLADDASERATLIE